MVLSSLPPQLTTAVCAFSTATTIISLLTSWSSFFLRGWKHAHYTLVKTLCSHCNEEHLLLVLPLKLDKPHNCSSSSKKHCRPLKNENGVPAWKRRMAQTGAIHAIWSSVGAVYSTVDLYRQPSRTLLAMRLLLDIVDVPIKLVNLMNKMSTLLAAGPEEGVPYACRDVCLYTCTSQPEEQEESSPQLRKQDERVWYHLRANLGMASLIITPLIVIPELVAVILALIRNTDNLIKWLSILIGLAPVGVVLASFIPGGSLSGAAMASSQGRAMPDMGDYHQMITENLVQRFNDGRQDMAEAFLWGGGTILSAIAYVVTLILHWNEREASIRTREEAWIQLGEGVFGAGG